MTDPPKALWLIKSQTPGRLRREGSPMKESIRREESPKASVPRRAPVKRRCVAAAGDRPPAPGFPGTTVPPKVSSDNAQNGASHPPHCGHRAAELLQPDAGKMFPCSPMTERSLCQPNPRQATTVQGRQGDPGRQADMMTRKDETARSASHPGSGQEKEEAAG